jgi:hypothetical protein
MNAQEKGEEKQVAAEGASVTLTGTVEKIVPGIGSAVPEKAQIRVEGADDLYREIRIENTLTDDEGNKVNLKKGAEVEVTIQADADSIKTTGSAS